MKQISKLDIESVLFEGYERISRFLIHLDDVQNQFYNNPDSIIEDKKTFITKYESCLEELLIAFLKVHLEIKNNTTPDFQNLLRRIEYLCIEIEKLQTDYLIHLPRPNEPVELRRFIRVMQKQISLYYNKEENEQPPISIYIKEGAGDVAYAIDPIKDLLNQLRHDNNHATELNGENTFISDEDLLDNTIHITISRLDASNPFHWPTLLHEASHKLLNESWFHENNIVQDFIKFLNDSGIDINKEIEFMFGNPNEKNLKSWLTECWCDLFGCALMGPAFYYAQYLTFIHSLNYNPNNTHPPHLFRLKLIEKFLNHRFGNMFLEPVIENINEQCETILLSRDSKNNKFQFTYGSKLLKLLACFKEYFLTKFPFKDGKLQFEHENLKMLFDHIDIFVKDINIIKIKELSETFLSKGLPIPGHIVDKEDSFVEKPNSIQEILFAGCFYRNTLFKEKILLLALEISGSKILDQFKKSILYEFNRLEQSMLYSIQVSEWFDLLNEEGETRTIIDNKVEKPKTENSESPFLVDHEILKNLQEEYIRIIPIINIKKQLGSTSLDIRLGTTFEIYFPNQFGIVDFTDFKAYDKFKSNSRRIDLDFADHIPINPGQFMLCHSMEYIKLPDNILADLEGRSSFARLGLEIHMTAGFVDPGFEGVLTFEVFNAGTNPIMLYPSFRIGQLRFSKVGTPMVPYNKKHFAKYRGLLEHHNSKQLEDVEVQRIANEVKKKEAEEDRKKKKEEDQKKNVAEKVQKKES